MKVPTIKAVSVGAWLVTMVMLMPLVGCEGRAAKEAQQEAREARAMVERLRMRLQQAQRAIDDKENELRAVQRDRDELHRKVNELNYAKDAAAEEIEKVQGIAANWQNQATGQANTVATFEQQVAILTAQVSQLQATIEDQSATIAQQEETIATLQAGVAEMWGGGAGNYNGYTDGSGNY